MAAPDNTSSARLAPASPGAERREPARRGPGASTPGSGAARRRTVVAASAVGLFAVVVSATGSWIPSLWGDEAASVLSATRPFGSLLHMLTRVDAVHGLSYAMLHVWVRVAGSSPFAVRFPSAVAIGVCAAVIVWMCRRFGGLPFAVAAGVLTAILPQLMNDGEEARSYAFDAALAAALCAVVVEIARREHVTRRWWVAYGAVLAAGIWAFLYVGLMIPAVAVMVALTPALRLRSRQFAKASAWAVLAASPLIVTALIEHNQIAFLAGRHRASAYNVLVAMWFWQPAVAVVGGALIVVAAAGWAADAARTRRWRVHGSLEPFAAPPSTRAAATAPALPGTSPLRLETVAFSWLVVPMGLLLLSNAVVADYTPRYGAFAAPAVAVAMALGLRRLARLVPSRFGAWRAVPAVAVAVALVVAIAPVWAAQRGPYAKDHSDWNEIAATVAASARPGDGIVFDEAVKPSRRPRLAMDTNPGPFRQLRDVTLKTPYQRSDLWFGDAYSIPQAAAMGRFAGVDRVWLVDVAYGRRPSTWGRAALHDLGYRVVRSIRLHSSELVLYER